MSESPRVAVVTGAGAGIGGIVFAVCLVPQLLAYLTLYGRFGPSPLVTGKMDWTSPHAWQVLMSPENGLLFWTPLALPAIAGLVWLARGRVRPLPDEAFAPAWIGVVCLVMVASQIWVSGSVSSWTGSTFGQRRLVGLTVFFALGLASLSRVAKPVWARTNSASGRVIFSPASAANRFSSTRLLPEAITSSAWPLVLPAKTSDLAICPTVQPAAAAASTDVRVESGSSTT